jgi:hypothetical protein
MIARVTCILMLAILVAACAPLGAAPTPTAVPQQLDDRGMQIAAESAVREYATRNSYEAGVPSFTLVEGDGSTALVHAVVPFTTLKGSAPADYDALINLHNSGGGWQAEVVKKFSELNLEQALTPGPAKLSSGAGFSVQLPAGLVGYAASAADLKPVNLCGTGSTPISAVPTLIVMPGRYSVDNVPIILEGYQQCPRQPGLSAVRQRLEAVRASDPSLTFERLDLTTIGGQPALIAVVKDANGSTLYDVYVFFRDRQLEFTVRAKAGQDATKMLDALNSLQFN